jgi:hypothetical protein
MVTRYLVDEWILTVGLPTFDLEAYRSQRLSDSFQRDRIGVDAEIEIRGKSHVSVCCQRHGSDHNYLHASRFQDAGDLLGSPYHPIGLGH